MRGLWQAVVGPALFGLPARRLRCDLPMLSRSRHALNSEGPNSVRHIQINRSSAASERAGRDHAQARKPCQIRFSDNDCPSDLDQQHVASSGATNTSLASTVDGRYQLSFHKFRGERRSEVRLLMFLSSPSNGREGPISSSSSCQSGMKVIPGCPTRFIGGLRLSPRKQVGHK